MNSDERIKKVLAGKVPDTVPLCQTGFWPQTIKRWRNEGGHYIFHSDHSVPPTISIENYRYAVEIAREIGSYS